MADRIRVGVWGLGRAGNGMHFHELGLYPDLYEVVAGCDIDVERREAAVKKIPSLHVYDNSADFLKNPDIELVTIATRSPDHVKHAIEAAEAGKYVMVEKPIACTYADALKNVDWNRVAYFLRRADTPAGEKNKQVTGGGDTALEHTIIRWYVDSAPKGADVYWRVVSSTPDVKNTNQNFLGSTPYESTESFDIRGLTFNNSGDVQVEITCEKPGYITQRRRFNLRQAIEQKEISTKFNLVEE